MGVLYKRSSSWHEFHENRLSESYFFEGRNCTESLLPMFLDRSG